ncbi:MAG: ATP-binding protein, partial [Chitinispirillaceae bacterium]|nr:ATP-binding protein [Chitinispirillaceae bacterium]
MKISKIELINWKNFKRAEARMQDRVFIVGPNASGKSNFIDAIRFLRDIVKQGGGLQEAVNQRDGISKIRCVAARKNSDITIGIVVSNDEDKDEWEYKLTINQSGGGITGLRAIVKKEYLYNLREKKTYINRELKRSKEEISFSGGGVREVSLSAKDYSDKEYKESEYQAGFTHIEQATKNEPFKTFVSFLSEISYLHLIPQLVRDPKSFLKTSRGEDYYGRDFLERIQFINKKTRDAYLRRITEVLKCALSHLQDLQFKTDEMGVPHLEATFAQWRAQGVKHTERHFSDGTLRLIGLLWTLQDGNKPILWEEPELSLHSSIVIQLPDIIYQLQRKRTNKSKRQVILTTHSSDILNNKGIRAEEILLINTRAEEGSTIQEGASVD